MKKYPISLPVVPIFNDLETCVNCNNVWLEVDNSPDFDHCGPMLSPEYSLSRLTPAQKDEFLRIRNTAQCPLYDPVSEDGPEKIG
jgi:hypothetical protein